MMVPPNGAVLLLLTPAELRSLHLLSLAALAAAGGDLALLAVGAEPRAAQSRVQAGRRAVDTLAEAIGDLNGGDHE
jgi:hypothetical protein